jgi:secondary thiamine-phosphate synthase enzyme
MRSLVAPVESVTLDIRARAKLDVIDITERIELVVGGSGIEHGIALISCLHTTCGVIVNEYEDGLVEDLIRHLTVAVPEGYFAHDDLSRRTQNLQVGEPANGAAHVRQMFLTATSQTIPVVHGGLGLGTWQRILFVELDEPRPRAITVTVLG